MLRDEFFDGFQFDDDAFADNQVRNVLRFQLATFVKHGEFRLLSKRDVPQFELNFEALLLHVLGHSVTQLVVNLEGRAPSAGSLLLGTWQLLETKGKTYLH